jgi:Ca2+-transporting ATPase
MRPWHLAAHAREMQQRLPSPRSFCYVLQTMSKEFEPKGLIGLTDEEVIERQAADGYNELPLTKKRTVFHIAFEVAKEPMFILLLACGFLYLILGEPAEALLLLGFVFVVMGITLYQENKTERALEALRDLSSPRALVIRNGQQVKIAGREVVRDDIMLLSEGDRVPADAVVLQATSLSADESLLTGESVPVRKSSWDGAQEAGQPGGDDLPFVYSGSMVVRGQGIARVTSTGARTAIGRIGKALQTLETESTDLQRQTGRIVRTFAMVGAAVCLVIVLVFGLGRGAWLEGVLAGLSLAMATLPEEFPVVMTVFLALGAWRISKHNVLTRRVPAVEMLGAATVLCTDKTGTLTMNRMTVSHLFARGVHHVVEAKAARLPDVLHEVVEYALLASPTDPFDPMEKAMRELGVQTLMATEHLHDNWKLLREYPLTQGLLAMTRAWESPDGTRLQIAAKGAPEAIADLCHLPSAEVDALKLTIDQLAEEGLRVIGVAAAELEKGSVPEIQHDFSFRFIGLLGLHDPVRPGVPEAVAECRSAGIRVIMITGDYPGTARNIARHIGLENPDDIITGPELDAMGDEELARRIRTACIFARAVPEQKLRIVSALKMNDEVVAMTGDGVNDAPALKAAHIGIAMGGRGTDVARESAALVLLDDNFASIVQAVKMGRRIFDNLRKAMTFIFAVHLPIAGLSLLPVLFGWPLALMPMHIVFLELIIDPACSVVFEMELDEKGIMKRRPRRLKEPLFGRRMVGTGLVQGLSVFAVVGGIYAWALTTGLGEAEARTLAFINLVFGNLGMILSNRSWTRSIISTLREKNPSVKWVTGGAVAFLSLVVFVPFLRSLFRFAPLHDWEFALCLGTGLVAILCTELTKIPGLLRDRSAQGSSAPEKK